MNKWQKYDKFIIDFYWLFSLPSGTAETKIFRDTILIADEKKKK